MRVLNNAKAISTLIIILLLILSAIVGGIIAYTFTIADYIKMPEETALIITDVYINREAAQWFKINVLNPSYSIGNATITRIALSFGEETQLYDVVETEPAIEDGIIIPKGTSLNITCHNVLKDDVNVAWGRMATEFAGRTIIVHVFSSDSSASNKEASLPLVKLDVTDTDFDPKISFGKFNITMKNNEYSEINVTVIYLAVLGVDVEGMTPTLSRIITKEPVLFSFNGSWHGIKKTILTVYTEEGYIFYKELQLPGVNAIIQNVTLNEDYTDHFNVTILNEAESANYVNVTKITCTAEGGGVFTKNYNPTMGIMPNTTRTFTFNESWREIRGKKLYIKAYLLQDFETQNFTVTTPSPIIVKTLNENDVFKVSDKEHFNITLLNHQASLKPINVTKIVVKETGEMINGTKANPQLPNGPILPGQNRTFYCNITDWTSRVGGNLTLTIYVVTNVTSEAYAFEFKFDLPAAEINIANVTHTTINGTNYLNITLENMNYSVWNVTISKITIVLQNQSQPPIQFQIMVSPGDKIVILCVFDWEGHLGQNMVLTVISSEGIEASWQGTNW